MRCQQCQQQLFSFSGKLGRCPRCIAVLCLINLVLWNCWYWFFSLTPRAVSAIALIFAATCCFVLLALHLITFCYLHYARK